MFLKWRIRRFLRKAYVALVAHYGKSQTYTEAQINRVVTLLKVPRSFQGFVYALFGDDETALETELTPNKAVRERLVMEVLKKTPDLLSPPRDYSHLLDLDDYRNSRFHTPIDSNQNYWP